MEQDATLTVAPGGSIKLVAGSANIEGDLVARSGSISIETTSTLANNAPVKVTSPTPPGTFSLTIGPHAVLDTSGQWVNDTGADLNTQVGGAYVDGGSIALTLMGSYQIFRLQALDPPPPGGCTPSPVGPPSPACIPYFQGLLNATATSYDNVFTIMVGLLIIGFLLSFFISGRLPTGRRAGGASGMG